MNACPHEPVTLRPDELEIPDLLWHEIRAISTNYILFCLEKNLSLRSNEISYCTQMVLSKIRSGSIKRRRRKREERIVSKRIFGVQQATAKSRFNVIA